MSMLIFGICQFINVILGTLRSLCTIKSGKHVGMLMNVLAYTFYAAVTKLLTGQEMWFILVVTATTNCIGFYLADWIFKKMQKDKLWRISCTVPRPAHAAAIKVKLDGYGITYNETKCARATVLDIFSLSQGESSLIKEVIDKFNVKYHIIEIDKRL